MTRKYDWKLTTMNVPQCLKEELWCLEDSAKWLNRSDNVYQYVISNVSGAVTATEASYVWYAYKRFMAWVKLLERTIDNNDSSASQIYADMIQDANYYGLLLLHEKSFVRKVFHTVQNPEIACILLDAVLSVLARYRKSSCCSVLEDLDRGLIYSYRTELNHFTPSVLKERIQMIIPPIETKLKNDWIDDDDYDHVNYTRVNQEDILTEDQWRKGIYALREEYS